MSNSKRSIQILPNDAEKEKDLFIKMMNKEDMLLNVYICKGEGDCKICFSKKEKGEECRKLSCGHSFHKKCIDLWLNKNLLCPSCKEKKI